MGVPESFSPWARREDRRLTGVPGFDRAREVLDLAVLQHVGYPLCANLSTQELDEACADLFTDLSQNPARKAFSNQAGVSKCLTSSSVLYTHARDRVVLPLEMMFFQGHTQELKVPRDFSQKALKDLAGQGICLPCLGLIVYCLLSTGSLEA